MIAPNSLSRPLQGIILMLAGSAALLLAAPPAKAAEPRAIVSLAGMDTATASGRIRLDARIDRAARRVCGVGLMTDRRNPGAKARCADEAAARARLALAARQMARPLQADMSLTPSVVSPAEVRL